MKRRIVALTLALSALAASSALAQADLGIKHVGASLSYVSPENLDAIFGFGGLIDHGTLAPRFGLESRVEYWNWSEKVSGVESSVRDIVVGARTKYHFETVNPKIQPFIGAGLGMHLLSAEVTSTAPPSSASTSETKLGIDIGGGIAVPVSPRADFLGEVWNSFVDGTNQFSLRAGMQWKFGK